MKRDRDGPEGADQGRYSRLDDETMKYYEEIGAHFKTLEDDEEKQILADNVLGETEGRETEIVPDAACSRVLETVIPYASITAVDKFVRGCLQEDNLGLICTSGPFGSHVVEKVLIALTTAAATADDAGYSTAEGALEAFTDTAVANLYDMITSKYGSFVGRRLLSVLCGQDVVSAPKHKPGMTEGVDGNSAQAKPETERKTNHKTGGLAARVSSGSNAGEDASQRYGSTSLSFPQIFTKITSTVISDDWTGPDLTSIQCDPYAGPFLQSLLRATVALGDESLAGRLVVHLLGGNAASGPDTLSSDALHRLMTDRNGSHLMEAAFQAAPDDVLQKMCTVAFKGRLLTLAQHPCANFAVQAALAAVRRPQQLKRMFEDLRPHLAALLRARRGGVVTILLAAAGRVGSLEADCADALWHSVESGLDASAGPTPLHRMVTMDTTTKLGQVGGGTRLSPLGCAALVTLLNYPSQASKKWAEAVGNLTPSELGAMARDPGGCRVIETYLEGPGGAAKKRRRVLQALNGNWANAASTVAGCRFVEKCYDMADADGKESITAELAAAEERLGMNKYGVSLLQRCHVDAYKRGGGDWKKRVENAEEIKKEFEDLFGDEEAEEGAEDKTEQEVVQAEAKKEEKKKRKKHEEGEEPRKEKKKKKKKDKGGE